MIARAVLFQPINTIRVLRFSTLYSTRGLCKVYVESGICLYYAILNVRDIHYRVSILHYLK